MTEPTTCKCGGMIIKIVTPNQYDMPADSRGVIHRKTVSVDFHFRCRSCFRESARDKNMLCAIANWQRDMKYQIQIATKKSEDWETRDDDYYHIGKARNAKALLESKGLNQLFRFRIVDQNGKVVN